MKKTKWISNKNLRDITPYSSDLVNESLYFRRLFTIKDEIKSADLCVCALGLGVYYINGQRITDRVLDTPYTAYHKRVIYNSYDVTSYLKKGDNAIGIHVGNGMYNNNALTWNDMMAPWRSGPKLAVKLTIKYTSGNIDTITTDELWKTTYGPCLYNHMRQGEKYDASLKQEGFTQAEFDDSSWENAIIVRGPGGVLEKNICPPVRVCETIKPVSKVGNIYDFGVNISGWVKIKLTGRKGQSVSITYDEALNENGDLLCGNNRFFSSPVMLQNQDIFICSGKENEEFNPEFNYHGFRYVKIENAPENIEVVAQFVHTDFEVVGEFVTDNPLINKIHEISLRSILSNYVGIPTDCPHREQNGWTGDALCSVDQTFMNYNANNSYFKWLNDFKDAQRPSGQLPGIIPSAGWGYNWGSGPAWDSALILIPYKAYIITGDKSMMENMWDNMTLYIDYLESMERSDGTICFGLGDWCPPNESFVLPTEVTDIGFYYYDLKVMSYMADVLDKDSTVWEEKAKRIKEIWRNKFLNNKELKKYQAYYAVAIYFGLVNEQETKDFVEELVGLTKSNDYHIDCGFIGIKAIFDVLSDNGYADILYKMVTNPTYPSYAWWVNNGMTTLCETWDMKASRNHHMFSEVENWFYKHIAGINFGTDGLTIKPSFIDEIQNFNARYKNIYTKKVGNQFTVKIDRKAKILINGICKEYQPGEYTFEIK